MREGPSCLIHLYPPLLLLFLHLIFYPRTLCCSPATYSPSSFSPFDSLTSTLPTPSTLYHSWFSSSPRRGSLSTQLRQGLHTARAAASPAEDPAYDGVLTVRQAATPGDKAGYVNLTKDGVPIRDYVNLQSGAR